MSKYLLLTLLALLPTSAFANCQQITEDLQKSWEEILNPDNQDDEKSGNDITEKCKEFLKQKCEDGPIKGMKNGRLKEGCFNQLGGPPREA